MKETKISPCSTSITLTILTIVIETSLFEWNIDPSFSRALNFCYGDPRVLLSYIFLLIFFTRLFIFHLDSFYVNFDEPGLSKEFFLDLLEVYEPCTTLSIFDVK